MIRTAPQDEQGMNGEQDDVVTLARQARALDVQVQVTTGANWDERFMGLARFVASWSKDRSRKVGCVIVGPAREVRALGYNGFPRGVNDDVPGRHERPAKYRWTEHAERNAIYNAARTGVNVEDCVIYLPWFPCMDCARAIVQAGIVEVVAIEPDWNDPKFADDFTDVPKLLYEAGVRLRFVAGEAPKQQAVTT